MVFTLYINDIAPKMTTKVRTKPDDKISAHRASQKAWYQRRGCFLNYRNRVAKCAGKNIAELKHIESVDALELWCHDFILETTGSDLKENCVPYVVYMINKPLNKNT